MNPASAERLLYRADIAAKGDSCGQMGTPTMIMVLSLKTPRDFSVSTPLDIRIVVIRKKAAASPPAACP